MGLEPARVVEVIKQVCRGLAVAHQESPPIIHRDIKPQNILVGYESGGLRARVSDFGLARHVNPLTLLATAAGTLAFKPPEAFLLERADSRAGDVWALGVTLYLLLTDRLPVEEPAQGNWLRHEWKRKPVIPPSELSPLADTVLDRIILKALEFDPAKRFESAGEMLEALDGWQEPADRNTGTTMREETRKTDTRDAETMAEEALAMQRQGILEEAASLMEEAINRSPSLRQKHEHRVALWRRGISM
jgi:serine/threonine-protein kinase